MDHDVGRQRQSTGVAPQRWLFGDAGGGHQGQKQTHGHNMRQDHVQGEWICSDGRLYWQRMGIFQSWHSECYCMRTPQSEVGRTSCSADSCNRLGGTVPGSGSCVRFVHHPRDGNRR